MTTKEAAALWHITQRQVQIHCKNDRIPGVAKIGNTYLIPTNAQRPLYGYYYEPANDQIHDSKNNTGLVQNEAQEEQVIR